MDGYIIGIFLVIAATILGLLDFAKFRITTRHKARMKKMDIQELEFQLKLAEIDKIPVD